MKKLILLLCNTSLCLLFLSRCTSNANNTDKQVLIDTLIQKDIEFAGDESILFVQWQYSSDMDIFAAMDIRHKLETKIDKALRSKGLGEWIAGDMGPGGANMLYSVHNNPKSALLLIMNILNKEGYLKETVIAIRINHSPDDWDYKVLFPKDYNKEFNPI